MQKNIEFYEDIYNNCPDMVVVGDMHTKKIYDCNKTLLDKLGYTLEEIRDMPSYHSLYHPDCYEELSKAADLYSQQGFLNNFNLDLKTKNSCKIPVSINVNGIRDEEGILRYTRVFFRDITAVLDGQRLQKENYDLNMLVHLISHDLKAPLSAIERLSEWITEDCNDILPEESRQHLQLLKKRVKRTTKLLHDLHHYVATENKQDKTLVHFNDMIAEIMDNIEIPKGFLIVNQASIDELYTKKIHLQRILCNLILNAIKHHHNPSQGKVIITAEDKGDYYHLEISDNGPGIPSEYHSYVFEPLKTLHSKDIKEGSGMGLAIVKRIIKGENSCIQIKSTAGQGSKFIFTWPKFNNELH